MNQSTSATHDLVHTAGIRWEMVPAWASRAEQVSSIDWFRLAGDPRAELIKANPNRQVWRVQLDDVGVFAKVYLPGGWRDHVRCLFRGSEASLEWQAGLYAESQGIPCARHVACGLMSLGQKRIAGVLITEEVADSISLTQAWLAQSELTDRAAQRSNKAALIEAVADLLTCCHEHRFCHRDMHPHNVLISPASTDGKQKEVRALLLDLYDASCDRAVDDELAANNLADLNQWFQQHASQSDRLRFLKSCLRLRGDGQPPSPEATRTWASRIGTATQQRSLLLCAKRDRRILKRGTYFGLLNLPDGWRATVVLRSRNRDVFPKPINPDRSLDEWNTLLRNIGPARERLATGSVELGSMPCLLRQIEGQAGKRGFLAGQRLLNRNLPCVRPIAILQKRKGLFGCQSVVIHERRPRLQSFNDLLANPEGASGSWGIPAWRTQWLESIGRLIALATLRGVAWMQPESAFEMFACSEEEADGPRALFEYPAGLRFVSGVDEGNGSAVVASLVGWMSTFEQVTPEDGAILTQAFSRRMGNH